MRRVGIIVGITLLALVAFATGCAKQGGRAQGSGPGDAEVREAPTAPEASEGQVEEQSGEPAQAPGKAEVGEELPQQGQAKHKRTTQRQGQESGRTPAERWQEALKKHDANKDGKLSKKEFKGRDRAFEKLDADGDGAVTQRELAGAAEQGRRRLTPGSDLMKTTDKDGDARISRDEWRDLFDETDADGDGFVTGKEVGTGMRHGAPHRADRRAGRGNKGNQ